MYITFCGATFYTISSPIDTFESLIWTQRWYEAGSFQISMPAKYFAIADAATFIFNSDRDSYMVIEDIQLDSEKDILIISGRSLESMMEWRFCFDNYGPNQLIESEARGFVSLYASALVIADFAFVNTPITLAPAHGYTQRDNIYFKVGTTISDAIFVAYSRHGWSYTLKRKSGTTNLEFDTVVGLDRRSTQSANARAIFSTTAGDIGNYSYNKSKKDIRNYAYLRTVWGYDSATGTANGSATRGYNQAAAGEEKRVIFFEGNENYATDKMDLLCKNELLKYPAIEAISCSISPTSKLIYGTDYSLGDYCDVAITELGMTLSAQVTAVDFVYEKGTKFIVPTLGREKLNPQKYIKREAGK